MTDRPLFYLLDEQGEPIAATDKDHQAVEVLLKDNERRRVAVTEKIVAGHSIVVSTIFLCADEQYLLTASESVAVELFQTCIFTDAFTGKLISTGFECCYPTREEALEGHDKACQEVDILGIAIVKGWLKWSDLGKKLSQQRNDK